jgi:hypothetical protein
MKTQNVQGISFKISFVSRKPKENEDFFILANIKLIIERSLINKEKK